MQDRFGREIDYLRLSVTDRCNLRCVYCMPEGGAPALERGELLEYEELVRLTRILARLGVRHVRLTGGEPMARRGCLDLVRALHALPGIESVAMTSNGTLLRDRAAEAKAAGLDALNLSLDTLNPAVYARMTRGGDVNDALQTLEQSLAAGLNVKLNAVPVRGFNENELADLAALAKDRDVCVRFIELMPIGCARDLRFVPIDEVRARLTDAFGTWEPDEAAHGHGPARYGKPKGFVGSIGLIGALSHEFCDACNRVRLTADGRLKLCLNHTQGLDLRALLRGGADDAALEAAIRDAIVNKPRCHGFYADVSDREPRRMYQIGG